jgi:hypothetical protein
MKKTVALLGLFSFGAAQAATDLTPITAAQTDTLAVIAALTAMGVAVWGANYIRVKFFR